MLREKAQNPIERERETNAWSGTYLRASGCLCSITLLQSITEEIGPFLKTFCIHPLAENNFLRFFLKKISV